MTHGVSHLHKCDDIAVVHEGEIVDHGPYNELVVSSKTLRELIHSTATSDSDQYSRRVSDTGTWYQLCSKFFEPEI